MKEAGIFTAISVATFLLGLFMGINIKLAQVKTNVLTIEDCRGEHESFIDGDSDELSKLLDR